MPNAILTRAIDTLASATPSDTQDAVQHLAAAGAVRGQLVDQSFVEIRPDLEAVMVGADCKAALDDSDVDALRGCCVWQPTLPSPCSNDDRISDRYAVW